MSYTVTQGKGSQARSYDGLTAAQAVEKANEFLADGRPDVAITGPSGPVDLDTLKLAAWGR